MKKTRLRIYSILLSILMITSAFSTSLQSYAAINQVSTPTYSDLTTNSVKLKWKSAGNVTGYYVYKYYKSNNSYKKIATVSKTAYTVSKLSAGTTYRFAVKAYKKSNGKTTTGKMSNKLCISTKPSTIKGLSSHIYDSASITLNWNKVTNASGYQVYKYNSSTKKYEKAITVTTNKAKVSSLKANTSYKFKVRAYRKVEGKYFYGSFSSVITKSTISNFDIKSKLLNGYLYAGSPQSPILMEYKFNKDGSYIINEYDCFKSSEYNGNGDLFSSRHGTYTVNNSLVKMKDEYNYTTYIFYNSNKKIYRSGDYIYGGDQWFYSKYYYKTSPVPKSERINYYSNHICYDIEI